MSKAPRATITIGWREWVSLPQLGLDRITAKIDTGARTSALHASNVKVIRHLGDEFVEFIVPGAGHEQLCTAPLLDTRSIKNTGGKTEMRFIIQTSMMLAGRSWPIELSLADRGAMSFDLILGRTAIRRRNLLINPGRSFLASDAIASGDQAKAS
ncbi:RimK/LysX family protein [Devosia rhodophyticola]|uniref:RimK/LysX family protein n=1 Tax=Devosia rhodophyticola TaxID=3026423 RepID=A0ABY7YXB6_9HYPH|nr:RimK/LysX family protein [Devosia rhodophyticola]WDR05857.1 RimK/LysX family protein [Devosia rhodophyticola]